MINVDTFTLGNEFKSDSGDIFKVTSNFAENNKIFLELTKVVEEEELEIIED